MMSFEVSGRVWRYKGAAAWHFVYVNEALSRRIRDATARTGRKMSGFGFVRVRATLGKTSWHTSLFPTKEGPYLLALKAEVRHKENVEDGDHVTIRCHFASH